jgi:hypothetical protein
MKSNYINHNIKSGKVYVLMAYTMVILFLIGCTLFPAAKPTVINDGFLVVCQVSGNIGGQKLILDNTVLIMLNENGGIEWETHLKDGSQVYSVHRTADGGFIASGEIFGGNLYLSKVDPSGDIEWEKEYQTKSFERGRYVEETKDGGFIICGEIDLFDETNWRIWLAKVDAHGKMEWSKSYSNGGALVVAQVDGGYTVFGDLRVGTGYTFKTWMAKTDYEGIIEWEKTIVSDTNGWIRAVEQTSDGGYVITGSEYSKNITATNVWLMKTDSDFVKTWDQVYPYSSGDSGSSVLLNPDGNYTILTNAGRIIRTDSGGSMMWERIADAAINLNKYEQVSMCPVLQIGQGYLVAIKRVSYELPVNPSVMSPFTSQRLLFTKINTSGEFEWETQIDLPIKQ